MKNFIAISMIVAATLSGASMASAADLTSNGYDSWAQQAFEVNH